MISTASSSPLQTLKRPLIPHLNINCPSRLSLHTHDQLAPSSFWVSKSHSLLQSTHTSSFLGFSVNKRFGFSCNRLSGLCVNAEKGESGESKNNVDEADKLARSESTMPERFRYLTKEAPEPPVRWPWFVGNSSELCSRD